MGLRDRMGAMARGEVSTDALAAYSVANSDAYDLLDNLPPEGPARLSAWCAFVIQTHADDLIGSGSSAGFCDQAALDDAAMLYQFAGAWLNRARAAQASAKYSLDTSVPQPYSRASSPLGRGQVKALMKTLETVQSRLGADLSERESDPVHDRVAPALPALQSALDAGAAINVGKASPEMLAMVGGTLAAALDRAYQAGQLLAMPELIAKPTPPPPPAATGAAGLTMFLPGDPGFDRWCLTDPLSHIQQRDNPRAPAELDAFWRSDPEPAKTIALQAEIAAAIEGGIADYLPETPTRLVVIAETCPWPGVLIAKQQFVLGGRALNAGDRFILSVGPDSGGFRRKIEVSQASQAGPAGDEDLQREEDERWARKRGFE